MCVHYYYYYLVIRASFFTSKIKFSPNSIWDKLFVHQVLCISEFYSIPNSIERTAKNYNFIDPHYNPKQSPLINYWPLLSWLRQILAWVVKESYKATTGFFQRDNLSIPKKSGEKIDFCTNLVNIFARIEALSIPII